MAPADKRPPQRTTHRPRTGSRIAAVQALFQSEQGQENPETVIDQFVRHRLGVPPGDASEATGFEEGRVAHVEVKLFAHIVRTAAAQQEMIDA